MNDQNFLQQFEVFRGFVIKALEGVSEEEANVIPEGFRNNIRWNAGHVYVTAEQILFGLSNEKPQLPEHYQELFASRTSPADWKHSLPSLDEIKSLLKEQPIRFRNIFAGRLSEKAAQPFKMGDFMTMETIAELLNFILFHDGLHIEAIKSIRKVNKK